MNTKDRESNMILEMLIRFRGLILALVVVGIIASILEAVGITLFIPILEGVVGKSTSSIPFPLNRISFLFSNFSLVERLRVVAISLIFITLVKCVALYLNGILSARLEVAISKYQLMRCFRRLLNVEMAYFHAYKGAYFHTILSQYIGVYGNITRAVADAGPFIFTFIVLFCMLLLVSWKLTLVACSFAIFSSFIVQKLERKAVSAGRDIAQSCKRINSTEFDLINGMKTIRLFNRQQIISNKFEENLQGWADSLIGVARAQAATRPVFEITSTLGLSLLIIVGSFVFYAGIGKISLELLLTFLLIFSRLMPPISTLTRTRVSISTQLPIHDEVAKFFKESSGRQIKDGNKIFWGLQKGIELKKVEFGYNPRNCMVLRNISLYIPKGFKVGVVGPSGSGKSTFADLLLRFYDQQSGLILMDGIDLRELKLESWRKYIGVVEQSTFLFNDTVKFNIAYAKPEATQEEIEQATRRAHAHEFIKDLPYGYDTLIGDRGVLLSGGQRQRLAIARAIITNPDILIFDEATSALDTESEQLVQKALNEVGEGRTVITIAHRLSTITDSDMIIVFDTGRIVQQGTHAELLLQKDGLYSRLVHMQSIERKVETVELDS